MRGAELDAEMRTATFCIKQPHLDRLLTLGCSARALAALGQRWPVVGVSSVTEASGGLYEPDPQGAPMVIQPVLDRDCEEHETGVIDLVAWSTTVPDRWLWRTGTGFALGAELLLRGEPIRVVARPVDWLAAAGEAVCVLDWSASSPVWSALRTGPSLSFTDDTLRQRVRTGLVSSITLPTLELSNAA